MPVYPGIHFYAELGNGKNRLLSQGVYSGRCVAETKGRRGRRASQRRRRSFKGNGKGNKLVADDKT